MAKKFWFCRSYKIHGAPEKAHVAARRSHQAHQDLDGRGLAGSVGAEEAERFAAGHREADAPHGFHAAHPEALAVDFAEPVNLNKRVRHDDR